MADENELDVDNIPDSIPSDKLLDAADNGFAELVELALDDLKDKDYRAFADSFNLLSFALPSQDRDMIEGLYGSFLDEAKSRGLKLSSLGLPSCPFSLIADDNEFILIMKDDLQKSKEAQTNLYSSNYLDPPKRGTMPGIDELKWLPEAKRIYSDGLESFKSAWGAKGEDQKMAFLESMADFELALAYFPNSAYLERDERVLREEIGFDYVHCCNKLARIDSVESSAYLRKAEPISKSLTVFDRFILWSLDKLGR